MIHIPNDYSIFCVRIIMAMYLRIRQNEASNTIDNNNYWIIMAMYTMYLRIRQNEASNTIDNIYNNYNY